MSEKYPEAKDERLRFLDEQLQDAYFKMFREVYEINIATINVSILPGTLKNVTFPPIRIMERIRQQLKLSRSNESDAEYSAVPMEQEYYELKVGLVNDGHGQIKSQTYTLNSVKPQKNGEELIDTLAFADEGGDGLKPLAGTYIDDPESLALSFQDSLFFYRQKYR